MAARVPLVTFVALFTVVLSAAVATAQPQAATPSTLYAQIELGSHAGAVRRIAVDSARGVVATGGDDKTVRLWALAAGELQQPSQVLRAAVNQGEGGRVYGVAFHPREAWLAFGGTAPRDTLAGSRPAIHVIDTHSGRVRARADVGAGEVKRLVWSGDGSLLIAGLAAVPSVRAFDAQGRQVFSDAFGGAVYALAVAPGLLAAAGLDGSLRVYSVNAAPGAPPLVQRLRTSVAANPVSLAFSPDAKFLAVGYFSPGKPPDVVDVDSGRVSAGLGPAGLGVNTVMSVAWSGDGQRIFAAGSYPFDRRNARLVSFAPGSRQVEEFETTAPSTITDLVTLPDGRVAFASADGSWGTLMPTRGMTAQVVRSRLPDMDGANHLHIAADGKQLSWTLQAGQERVSFDLARRTLADGAPTNELLAPLRRRGWFDAPADWENQRRPMVNGSPIEMASDEVSRAVALFAGGRDAALGTSKALYRIGARGEVLWRRAMHTEVRAVNVSADGRVLAAAMLDGTVRLFRADDGLELLAILALLDRRWVIWSPAGYFDCAVGADGLVGWVANRADGSGADYYPAARLRERLHQPRYFELLLETLDPQEALRRHRHEIAAEEGNGGGGPAAQGPAIAVAEPPVSVTRLPPGLSSPLTTVLLSAEGAGGEVEIPLTVRSQAASDSLKFEVRFDGRPGDTPRVLLSAASAGARDATARLRVPAAATSVQLLALDANGYSEALHWRIQRSGSAGNLAAPGPGSAALPSPRPVAPATRVRGRLFALVVGVSDYERQQYKLKLAAKDAADFSAVIKRQHGKFYGEVVVRELKDRRATRQALLAELEWLGRVGGKDDTFMLFLAGHGVNDRAGNYYFLTADARREALRGSAVADRDIREALRTLPGRTVLFIDTCHAGNVLGDRRDGELTRFINDISSAENGVVVFAASSGQQDSQESDDWDNGAFTLALVGGLRGKADPLRMGRITYKGLDYFVAEEVRRLTQGRQTPVSLSPLGLPDFELAWP